MRKVFALVCVLLCAACESKQEGASTTYHLQEHTIELTNAKVATVIVDCRGNEHLSWEMLDSEALPPPAKVSVFCGMYLNPPAAGEKFSGWGWSKTNWAQSEGCTHDTASKFGEESCSDYFRAARDSTSVGAPWCQISFSYDADVSLKQRLVTYCK